jgi:hypothetical protein
MRRVAAVPEAGGRGERRELRRLEAEPDVRLLLGEALVSCRT